MSKRSVLILCTGNSCRSQMAEGLVNHDLGERWQAYSAGTRPAGYVHPMAIAAMNEIGVDISRARSKSTDEFRDAAFDLVITVCDSAAEDCPIWLRGSPVVHIRLPDPAQAVGTDAERMTVFRSVRDDARKRLRDYLTQIDLVEAL